jgi:hypothetical protein
MTMKHSMKAIIFVAALSVAYVAQAQNSNVVSAYNYLGDGNYAKAIEYIEPATTNESTSGKEKTWRYRGNIYAAIAMGKDEALKTQFPNATQIAIESYIKANELDTKGNYREENDRALKNLQITVLNNGNDAFNNKQYDQAIADYALSARVAKVFNEVDSNAVYNSALANEAKGDTATAMQRYQECINIGYDKPEIYRHLAGMQKRQGDLDGAIATSKAGLARYPDNKEIMLDVVAFLLDANRTEEAETAVKAAIDKAPDNPMFYYVLGNLDDAKANPAEGKISEADMIKWYDQAEANYKKSITLDSTFFDSYYNIGVLYNNRAAYEYEKCAQIKDDAQYTKCKKVADDIYLKTIPYFEKAHELKPDDVPTMQQLKKLYAKTANTDKYNAIKKELGE